MFGVSEREREDSIVLCSLIVFAWNVAEHDTEEVNVFQVTCTS